MMRGKRLASKGSTAGRRLAGAMREVQTLEFARRLREVRESLELSQAQFATIRNEPKVIAGVGTSTATSRFGGIGIPSADRAQPAGGAIGTEAERCLTGRRSLSLEFCPMQP